jgi:hypothetical protein
MKRLWCRYSLVWAMLALMLVFGTAGFAYDRYRMQQQAAQHGRVYHEREAWIEWGGHNADRIMASATLILLYSLARKWFRLEGSPVSKDGDEARMALLREIGQKLDALRQGQLGYRPPREPGP